MGMGGNGRSFAVSNGIADGWGPARPFESRTFELTAVVAMMLPNFSVKS
jgi:hypothetical protein